MQDYWAMTEPRTFRSAVLKQFFQHSRHLLSLTGDDYGVRQLRELCQRHRARALRVLRCRYGLLFS